MIFSAPHLLETALLMLVAFLAGAPLGLLLRVLFGRARKTTAFAAVTVAEVAATPLPAAPQLVTAPEIAPLPVAKPKPALPAAPPMPAVKMPAIAALPAMPSFSSLEPSRQAGETVAGRHIENPEHPQPASLDDVRAELAAQIDIAPASADATIIPAAVAQPEPAIPAPEAALAAETETPMLAEVTDAEAEAPLPVEERAEPAVEATPVVLTDTPAELAVEIQDVIETPDEAPVPDVVAEAPLVEPTFEKEAEEAKADTLFPPAAEPEVPVAEPEAPAASRTADDELAAMRAIEGGWSPRRTATARRPAELPEGVSADVAAADHAVAQSATAVASATALATAVLQDIAPASAPRPAGGFGRPASLPAPRDGGKDDFSQIKGLGPAVESSLNGLGIYHFDQIADWDQKAVVWIESHFGFRGRIGRERWQEQARDLVRGKGSRLRR